MKKFVLLLIFISSNLFAQIETFGDQSPVLVGVNNRVNYKGSEKKVYDIPSELIPYLSGLLIINKISPEKESIDQALNLWISKYSELKSKINAIGDDETKAKALKLLDRGAFNQVEQVLKIKTNYNNLTKILPESFVTKGDKSPIIVGDYANVSYVVNKVIEYKLPEGLTITLLEQLKDQSVKISDLSAKEVSRERDIQKWIDKYNSIKTKLTQSPGKIRAKALGFFEKGDLDGAIKALDTESIDDSIRSQNKLLKAKILILQLTPNNLDKKIIEIDQILQLAVLLDKNLETYLSYSEFLIEYRFGDKSKSIPYLEKAIELTSSLETKLKIYNYLAVALPPEKNLKAIDILKSALNLVDSSNSNLITDEAYQKKSLLELNLAKQYGSMGRLEEAISYARNSISSAQQIKDKAVLSDMTAISLLELGLFHRAQNNLPLAEQKLQLGIDLLSSIINNNIFKYSNLLIQAYQWLSEIKHLRQFNEDAIFLLEKAKAIAIPLINPNSTWFSDQYSRTVDMQLTLLYPNFFKNLLRIREILSDVDTHLGYLVDVDYKKFGYYIAYFDLKKGFYYKEVKEYETALVFFQSSHDYFKKFLLDSPSNFPSNLADCITNISYMYLVKGDKESALSVLEKSISEFESTFSPDTNIYYTPLPYLKIRLGYAYLEMGRNADAKNTFKKAIEQLKPLMALNEPYLFQFEDVKHIYRHIHLRDGDISEAKSSTQDYIKRIEGIIALKPSVEYFMAGFHARAINELGLIYYAYEKDYVSAEKEYLKAIQIIDKYKNSTNEIEKKKFIELHLNTALFYQSYAEKEKKKKRVTELQDVICDYASKANTILLGLSYIPEQQRQTTFNLLAKCN